MRYLFLLFAYGIISSLQALEKQPATEYHMRRMALAEKLHGGAALIFGADEPTAEYQSWRQDENFYYLTGWNEPGAALLIEAAATTKDPNASSGSTVNTHESYRETLFLPNRNPRTEKYKGVGIYATTPGANRLVGVDTVRSVSDLLSELVRLMTPLTATSTSSRLENLIISTDDLKAREVVNLLGPAIGTKISPKAELSKLTQDIRMTKTPGEIELLRKASNASVAAHQALLQAIEPGVSERTISGLIDYKLKANGCERPSYPSIVGSGANAAVLHYDADENPMHDGDLVVIDAAGEYSMYASDVTRTLPVNGHFTSRQREIYDIVLGAQRAAIKAFISGKSIMGTRTEHQNPDSLNKVAYDYINTHGKSLQGEPLGKYWVHGLGHSVGLNVHDPYDYNKPFGPGSVFTLEPGVYIPEEKIGIRIEDTFYVDTNGRLINLTGNLPHTADEVEAAMRH